MIHNSFKKGFSLLEMLVYIAVLAVATLIVVGVFISINQGRARTEAVAEVNSNIRFTMEKINQDLKSASSVSVPATAGATSTSLTIEISGTEIVYCVSSGYLRRQSAGACGDFSETITSDTVVVDNMVFERIENSNPVIQKTIITVKTSVTMSYNSSSPEWQYTGTKNTSFSLR